VLVLVLVLVLHLPHQLAVQQLNSLLLVAVLLCCPACSSLLTASL
jgi:hypothetical protein